MMIDKSKTCCFTGHRPEKIYGGGDINSIHIRRVLSVLRTAIDEAVEEGYTTFITGMARGIDLWASRFVIELKAKNPDIKLVCALPYRDHGKDFEFEDKWNHMLAMSVADMVVYVSETYSDDVMKKRNQYMVDNSSKVIAVIGDYRSGTGQTLRYAQKKGLKTRVIDLNENAPMFCAYT